MKINDILTKWILKTYSVYEKCVQILYSSINNTNICPKCTKPTDWMGRIRTASLLCTRITLETTALRVIWELRSRRTGVFPEVQVCVSECFWGPRTVFQICEKSWFFTTSGSKKSSMSQTLWPLRTRLLFYDKLWYFDQMNPQDVFYVGKIPTDSVSLNK